MIAEPNRSAEVASLRQNPRRESLMPGIASSTMGTDDRAVAGPAAGFTGAPDDATHFCEPRRMRRR